MLAARAHGRGVNKAVRDGSAGEGDGRGDSMDGGDRTGRRDWTIFEGSSLESILSVNLLKKFYFVY